MNLGLAEGELGQLTLGQLGALNEALAERQNREDWRAAMIFCAIANTHRSREDGPVKPEDVMPWLGPWMGKEKKEKPKTDRVMTAAETRVWFEELTALMGGIVHQKNVPLA